MKTNVVVLLIVFALVITGCGPRETLIEGLGNAENSLFTSNGRLLITGADIWEIKQTENAYEAEVLTENLDCIYAGIDQYKNYIFAVCSADKKLKPWLLRAELAEEMVFEKIYPLTGFTMANGMAIDATGHVYIADETIVNAKGRIVSLSLTQDDVPEVVPSSEKVWLSGDEGAQSPNGVTIIDNYLFFTNLDIRRMANINTSVKRVAIEGDTHGAVETVYKRKTLKNSSFFDDLTHVTYSGTQYLIMADYLKGTTLAVEAFKTNQPAPLYETEAGKFAGPTSCIVGQGIGFGITDLLVTEGGIVTVDPKSKFGNRLSIVRYQPEE